MGCSVSMESIMFRIHFTHSLKIIFKQNLGTCILNAICYMESGVEFSTLTHHGATQIAGIWIFRVGMLRLYLDIFPLLTSRKYSLTRRQRSHMILTKSANRWPQRPGSYLTVHLYSRERFYFSKSSSLTPFINASNLNVFFTVPFRADHMKRLWHSCLFTALKGEHSRSWRQRLLYQQILNSLCWVKNHTFCLHRSQQVINQR